MQIDYSLIELMLNSYLFNNMGTGELQMKTIVIGDLMLDIVSIYNRLLLNIL